MSKPSGNIAFKYLLNFRDIGGVPVSGKKQIREGIVFRSANPDRISKGDLKKLRSLNIRSVIDLRAPGELGKRYKTVGHADKLILPLDFQKTTRDRLRPVIYKKDAEKIIADISNELYLEILDASGPAFKQLMELLASPGRSPVLIHCHAGKDRTGIIIALILLAMGVDRELIISDFMKSNEALMSFFKTRFLFRKIISFGFFPYRNMVFAVEVKRRNIESVLDRVEFHYGGIEGYLRYAGFDISSLQKVRDILIED